jgi:nucleoside phosphorylase
MSNEYDLARKYAAPGTLVLKGVMTVDDLQKQVPQDCKAIMSFGMAGGLRPGLPVVGQTVIASRIIGPNKEVYHCDHEWHTRLFLKTSYYVQSYLSTGQFNQSNTPEQRAALYAEYGAWCMEDEGLAVAQFAQARGIALADYRNISDAWNDNVSITSNILNAGGGADFMAVLKDVVTDPEDMVKIGIHYATSEHWLEVAAQKVAPNFGWQ